MAKKTLLLSMEVEVEDLPIKELRENARLSQCKVRDLPRVEDVEPFQVADSISGSLDINEELFAGSDMHIRVTGAKVISADWKPIPQSAAVEKK